MENTNGLSVEELNTILKTVANKENIELTSYEKNQMYIDKNDDFYNYFCMDLRYTIEGNSQELTLIGKRWKASYKVTSQEHKEKQFYKCAPIDSTFHPKLVYCKDNLTIFEDYTRQGFEPLDQENIYDLAHIKLAIKCLAKFHATSLLQQDDGKESYRNADFDSTTFNFETYSEELKKAIKMLSSSNLVSEKLNDNLDDVINFAKKTLESRPLQKVLCHGLVSDAKNWLFKYDGEQRPIDCMLINYENSYFSSPVLDVLEFIYVATKLKTRQIFLDELLQYYYSCLQVELFVRRIDVSQIISQKEDFDVAVYCFLPFVKINTLIYRAALYMNNQKNKTLCKNLLKESLLDLEYLVDNKSLYLEDIFTIVKNKLKTPHFVILNYSVKQSDDESGFLGSPNKLRIEILTQNNDKVVLKMFAKLMPTTKTQIGFCLDAQGFVKEIFAYDYLIPVYRAHGLDFVDDCVVPCYFARHNHIIILEDMSLQGYQSLDPRCTFEYQLVRVLLKKLAKWHACSLITEENISKKTGRKFRFGDSYPRELREGFLLKRENHLGSQCIQTAVKTVEHQLKLFNGWGLVSLKHDLKTITVEIEKMFDLMFELVKPSETFRNVVCHGDIWANNILVKTENGIDCRLIDLQLTRYCPPAQDVLALLYVTMENEELKVRFNDLIAIYYEELSTVLSEHFFNVEDVLPFGEFLKSIEYMKPQAICQATLYHQLTLINSEIAKTHMATEEAAHKVLMEDREDIITHMFEEDPLYRKRAKQSLSNLLEICERNI